MTDFEPSQNSFLLMASESLRTIGQIVLRSRLAVQLSFLRVCVCGGGDGISAES
jgi:hypothetical protein